MKPVQRYPSTLELRKFGVAMLGGFAVIGGVLWWWKDATTVTAVCWVLGLALLLCSLWKRTGQPVYYVWMTAAMWMGAVVTAILLTVLYVVFLPFMSLIRLWDPLRYKLRSSGSYWEDHPPHEPTLDRTMRPF